MIHSGFRPDNNCEILMPKGMKWIFPYIFALYYSNDESFFLEQISDFSEWLYNEFDNNNYFDIHVSYDEFANIINYFKNIDPKRLNSQMQAMLYYLDDYREAGSPIYYFMERAFFNTKMWSEAVSQARTKKKYNLFDKNKY